MDWGYHDFTLSFSYNKVNDGDLTLEITHDELNKDNKSPLKASIGYSDINVELTPICSKSMTDRDNSGTCVCTDDSRNYDANSK